jgi:hypothetical protein
MTFLEALNTEVNNQALCNKILVIRGLDPDSEFTSSDANDIEIAKAFCFRALVTQPDFSEDGLSITLNRSSLISEANRIFEANDLTDEMIVILPIIDDKSQVW